MNNDDKILKILEDLQADVRTIKATQQSLQDGQARLEKGQQSLQAEVTVTIRLQQQHGQKLDAQGKDILIVKGATAQALTIAEAVRAGVESTQATAKTTQEEVEAMRSEMVTKAEIRTLIVRGKTVEERVENLERSTQTPNPFKH